ncbi:hypothetical protein JAAARDRAFT_138259 [Jaapia argillacea MUCL 33604]|uniref:SHSP domain-containing protein n=1 Tax=Jaapia argillacea MUCL 33604 TaxID=933084 RepID=A0A067PCN7_9AGAM|nr:hypothetical protein JAAARDRAFT_138259 [Jaapia argillacea MUCL 33604]
MHVSSSPSTHKLSVTLGKEFHPEMVTISAKEGNRLDVVADLWDREEDCRHEWHVRFPKNDVDMGSIRAVIEEKGELVIDVKRRDCTPQ